MKAIYRKLGGTVAASALMLVTGCDTVERIADQVGTINGQPAGQVFKSVIAGLSPQQQQQLQNQAPTTYSKLENNDKANSGPTGGQPAQPAAPDSSPQMQTLTLEDVQAMVAAGVKPESILRELEKSNSKFTSQDLASAQQATPPIDPTILDYMKNNPASRGFASGTAR